MLAGIDYGSRLAGTTSICFEGPSGEISFISSQKGQDADAMIVAFCNELKPVRVFLDAPISLPLVYSQASPGKADYFYRHCDREAGAMSPMFLGGLTARAMKLSSALRTAGVEVFETYPKWHALQLHLMTRGYKKNTSGIRECTDLVLAQMPVSLKTMPASWHEFDALLALRTACRHRENKHITMGHPAEGLIFL